jgi:flagellar biosynthetic protein FliR
MGMVLEQLIIGIIIGFFIQLVFQIFSIMGELISSQAGFEFARMMDVMSGFDSPTVTQLYTVLVSLLFLSLDGHLVLIKFVVDSFRTLPMGSIRWMDFPLQTLVTLIQWAFERGLQVALPAVVSLLVTNMAFGVIVRISPQLNIFSLGFSVTLYLGMFAIYWTLGIVQPHFSRNLDENLNFLEHFLHD